MKKTYTATDKKTRCSWCSASEEYMHYHDTEWGFPVDNDQRLFEKISLEGFQSGLSWRTILSKRENFRKAFYHFDFNRVSKFTHRDLERLLKNEGIVRHRGKIEAVINNASRAQELVAEAGSLAAYFWAFESRVKTPYSDALPSTTSESVALAKDLKKRGWKFVGPTTAYAFMQAMGMVNDHAKSCFLYPKIESARRTFVRPAKRNKSL